jgi:hypothetical protein
LSAAETIQHPDGRVELRSEALEEISHSPLFNHDLAPVPVSGRNWTTYNYAALWISMAHCIPTYMLSSGLISQGMNWWQALITILLGQHHRFDSDPPEFSSRNKVRNSLPGLCARSLWNAGFKCAGADEGDCGVWLVWHPGMDWR